MLRFPKDFVWGSSTSGPQTEGRVAGDGKGDNLWDYWYQVEPNRYYNGIGPDKTSTFYENWEKDIELLVETGHTAFRTSIQWSRIFPQVSDFCGGCILLCCSHLILQDDNTGLLVHYLPQDLLLKYKNKAIGF